MRSTRLHRMATLTWVAMGGLDPKKTIWLETEPARP